MSERDERRIKARDEMARQIKENSKGRVSSEQAAQKAKEIAQRVNRKKDS